MLAVSECVARAAMLRQESRGGHTRDDFPAMDPRWRQRNLVCLAGDDDVEVIEQPIPPMRPDLLELFDRDELAKYLTDAELPAQFVQETS
jgi:succinate dehydrogenase / fumarate reductase flavoprotein subunit